METDYYKKYEPLFGSWYIEKQIGEGSFGKVYIIERKEMGVTYRSALKVITIPQTQDEIKSIMMDGMSRDDVEKYYLKLVQDIVNEFVLMAKLKGNSNVVSYEDHILKEHDDGIGWDILIRMELLTPLYDYMSSNNITRKDIIKLGIDMCKALELCEKNQIIHRDIKPENIFVSSNGSFKLGDFGVAKTIEKSNSGLSKKGTYMYMAPEVYRGEPYDLTIDIYSLGIVMYRLVNNNRAPFLPDYPQPIKYTDKENALQMRMQGMPLPEPKNGTKELDQIIMKACAFSASERYQDAAQMRKALESLDNESENQKKKHETQQKYEELENVNPEEGAEDKKIQKGRYKRNIIIAAAIVILCIVFALFIFIPKNVTDIQGIGEETNVYIGDTISPDYKIVPDRFSESKIIFDADDESVISVDREGRITGRKIGESEIKMSVRGYEKNVNVKVVAKVKSITNVKKKITMTEGDSKTIRPKLTPEKFSNEKIGYKTDKKSVAVVSSKGKITAKSPGKARITISAGGCSKTITVVVEKYVAPVSTPSVTSTPAQNYNYNSNNNSSSGKSKRKSNVRKDDYWE